METSNFEIGSDPGVQCDPHLLNAEDADAWNNGKSCFNGRALRTMLTGHATCAGQSLSVRSRILSGLPTNARFHVSATFGAANESNLASHARWEHP